MGCPGYYEYRSIQGMRAEAKPPREPADLLPHEQKEALSRYYAGDKIKDIMAEFGIAGTAASFLARYPPQPDHQRLCPHCRVPLCARPATRLGRRKVAQCPNCGHNDSGNCRCDTCRAGKKRGATPSYLSPTVVAREQSLRRAWEDSLNRCPKPKELNLRQALYLAASIAGLDDTGTKIQAPLNIGTTIAPTIRYATEMLLALYRSDLVAPDPDQLLDVPETDVLSYIEQNLVEIEWRLALGRTADENFRYLKQLSDLIDHRNDTDPKEEIVAVWREVALAEAVAALTWCQRRFALKTEPHPRLVSALDTLLEHLSLGVTTAQTYYSARALAGEIHGRSGGFAPEHARLRTKMLNKLESIRNGEFGDPSAFERLRELPPSQIAELLCLPQWGIGAEAYWHNVPTIDALG